MIAAKTIGIAHLDRDDELLLTALTPELQKLVQRYAGDPKVFVDLPALARVK
jgi:hypothetical protein